MIARCSYVLTSVYGRTRPAVIHTLAEFIRRKNITVTGIEKTFALEALQRCRSSGRVSIVDALLWAEARGSANKTIYTFDVK